MPTSQARAFDDADHGAALDVVPALGTDTGAHVAQTIDAAQGGRTIVLTVDRNEDPEPRRTHGGRLSRGSDPSILDGGLEAAWIMPARGRRFDRDEHEQGFAAAPAEATVISLAPAPGFDDVEVAESQPAAAPAPRTPRPKPSFHAAGDDDAVARVAAERLQAEVRKERSAAVATPVRQRAAALVAGGARRRSGPVAPPVDRRAMLAPAPVEVQRHTVRISGTPDPLLANHAGTAVGARRPSLTLNPLAAIIDRPDRIALWAVLLGVFLVLVAATSG